MGTREWEERGREREGERWSKEGRDRLEELRRRGRTQKIKRCVYVLRSEWERREREREREEKEGKKERERRGGVR